MSSTLSQLNTLDISDCEVSTAAKCLRIYWKVSMIRVCVCVQQVTDSGIEQVTFNCRMLKSLYLANCHKVRMGHPLHSKHPHDTQYIPQPLPNK